MKLITLSLILVFAYNGFSQSTDLEQKMDSIIKEADLLYMYEKAAWKATDLIMANKKLKRKFGGYIVYHTSDTVTVSVINKGQTEVIVKYQFYVSDLDSPFKTIEEKSPLSTTEQDLLNIKTKIMDQLSDSQYEVTVPQNYDPNLVLIKGDTGYRLYILMGTKQSGIIPFGNDYIFKTNSKGDIVEWQKFHSRIIPTQSEIPGVGKLTSATHSHLRSTPYITATDICTFRLYAPYTELKEFSVYSPALGTYMKYNIEENKIKITE